MSTEIKKIRNISLKMEETRWKKLAEQRAETLKHFPEIKIGDEAIKLLESMSTPLDLLGSGLISKERYLQFLEDIENKKIRLAPSKIKIMQL